MNTQPQFREQKGERQEAMAAVKTCGQCGSRFSGDARFCPFDAEPLHTVIESVRPQDPLVGAIVDERYELGAVLGEGGMGTVYRARHRILGKELAIKVLRADLARDADLGLRFVREAKAAASISHPSVVQITDFGTLPSGQPYFVMEMLFGASLSTILRKGGPIPAARAVRLLLQIVEAFNAAHVAGVVHRDLKPDNILICPIENGEVVKVLDFGLAKVAGQSRLTKKGLVFGTPHYMSPEQASGAAVDERTDIYSLGIVMYEMFTGRVPFEADTYMGVLTKHLYVSPTPPSVLLGGVAELGALEQVTLRCLEKKPEKRYASMRALADELSRVARFNDAGALTLQPAELREPGELRLADELELPSAAELRLSLRRAGVPSRPFPTWAVPALSAASVLGVAAILFVAFRSGPRPAPHAALTASTPGTPLSAPSSVSFPAPARVVHQSASLPRLRSADTSSGVPEVPTAPKTLAGASSVNAGRAGGRAKIRTEGARASKRPATPGKMVAGEIVDPWSE